MRLLIVALLITSCSGPSRVPMPLDDGGPRVLIPISCTEEQILTDLDHCGVCDQSCDLRDANICEDGECKCGNGPQCVDGFDCRGAACVASDPAGKNCEFDQECVSGYFCIEGHCSFGICVDEDCDGVDNDCDNIVDEGAPGAPLAQWCFSGPEETWMNHPCQRGVRHCSQAVWSMCEDEVPPKEEIGLLACNNIDDNCDGCVDGRLEADGSCTPVINVGYDVLFIFDISGSMNTRIETVKAAASTFSSMFSGDPNFRFANVITPTAEGGIRGGVEVHQDFSDFATFLASIGSMPTANNSYEATYDAVFWAATHALGLSWRPEAVKIIILFSDEIGQSQQIPRLTWQEMCASMQHGEVFVTITQMRDAGSYGRCGTNYDITASEEDIVMNLTESIGDPCA